MYIGDKSQVKKVKKNGKDKRTKERTSKLKLRLIRGDNTTVHTRKEKREKVGGGPRVRAPRRYVREERTKRDNRPVDIINQEEDRKGDVGGEGERRVKKKLTRENRGEYAGVKDKRGGEAWSYITAGIYDVPS